MNRIPRRLGWGIVAGLGVFGMGACGPSPDFPATTDVAVSSGGESYTVSIGTGPTALANSTWAGYATEPTDGKPGEPGSAVGPYGGTTGIALTEPHQANDLLIRVTFGEGGRVVRFFDNHLYTARIIPELIVDGKLHPAAVPFVTYAQQSYGITVGSRFGLAAPIHVYALGVPVATGLAYAWGQVTGDRIDGIIGYATTLTLPFNASLSGADQFPFYAFREP